MENDDIVKRFVEKRNCFQKLRFLSIIGALVFAAIGNGLFQKEIYGAYSDMYTALILVWFAWGLIIFFYVGTVLSKCPVCHGKIHTIGYHQRGFHLSLWMDPLPGYCPHCGTNFSKHNPE